MNQIAVATSFVKSNPNMRPPASAMREMKPCHRLRSPSPATMELISNGNMPGSPFAVAKNGLISHRTLRPPASARNRLIPIAHLRSPSPASCQLKSRERVPGSLITNAVANQALKSRRVVRPNASANYGVAPRGLLRSPSPTRQGLKPTCRVSGSPLRTAVASECVKSKPAVRPPASASPQVRSSPVLRSPSPATLPLISTVRMPGSSIQNAVAHRRLTPTKAMRRPSPARLPLKPKAPMPGSTIPNAVAKAMVKSAALVRPPASAIQRLMPIDLMRSSSPASTKVMPTTCLLGSPYASCLMTYPLDDETDQRDWYEHHYLPLVRRYFAGEYIEPTLLHGGMLQESDDLKWDQRNGDDWATG